MDMDLVITRFFEYFSMNMLGAAFVIAVLAALVRLGRFWDQMFRWTSLLAVGAVGLFTAYGHVFMPERTAENIGWQTSPFQYEVGMMDLTLGVLGVMAFCASRGFRWATAIATAVSLWGCGVGHVRQMIEANNYAPGNAGPWFWGDVVIPLVMIVSLALAGRSACEKSSTEAA